MSETQVTTNDTAETTVPEKEFVRRLMTATCDQCDTSIMEFQYLNLPKDHGVYFQSTETPLMNACDYKSGQHVLQFGRCKSQENPKNKARGLVDKVVSNPLVKVLNPAAFAIDAVLEINEKLSGGNCKCNPMIMEVWEETNQGNCLDGADGILNTSKLACCYGGTITIKYADANGEEPQEPVTKKTVTERMPQSVAAQIEALNAEGMEDASSDDSGEASQGRESGGSQSGSSLPDGSPLTGSSSGTSPAGTDVSDSGTIPQDVMPMNNGEYGYDTQAIMEDMLNWYGQETDFEQNYAISRDMMYSNYANNRCRMMPLSALNDEGYICDISELSGFRMAGSSAALIGAGCVSAFNVMHALGMPRPFEDVIMAAEMQQTVPGFINQGPMAAGMVSTVAICTKMGLKARALEPQKLLKADTSVKGFSKNSVAIVGSTNPDGRAQFHTLKADAAGKLCCMENKKLSPQKLISANGRKQVIMQISAK